MNRKPSTCNICGDPAMFNRCEAHYRCDVCFTRDREKLCHRNGGVICDDCYASQVAERLTQEHDTQYTNEIVCPYCGYEWPNNWEMSDNDEVLCEDCGNTFHYARVVEVTYCAYKMPQSSPTSGA